MQPSYQGTSVPLLAPLAGQRPNLGLADFNPRLITAYDFSWSSIRKPSGNLEERTCLDYELEYIIDGGGSQMIDHVDHPMVPGLVVFRYPGQVTRATMPYRCIAIMFNLAGRWQRRPVPYYEAWKQEGGVWEVQPRWLSSFLDRLPPVWKTQSSDLLEKWFGTVLRHFINPAEGSELVTKAGILNILHLLHSETGAPGPSSGVRKPPLVAQTLDYMRRNFKRKLPLSELGSVAGVSPNYLQRVFKEHTGVSPLEQLHEIRLDHARDLLATTDMPALAIAQACGFPNEPYFFTLFRKKTGLSPGEFRSRYRYTP